MKIERASGERRKLDCYGNSESVRITYAVSGVGKDDVDNAVAEVFEQAPDSWGGIPRESVELLRSPGGGILEVAVNYRAEDISDTVSRKRKKSVGDRQWYVEVEAEKIRKNSSLGCVFSQSLDPRLPAPDPGVLIDWNGRYGSAASFGSVTAFMPQASLFCVATFSASKARSRSYIRRVINLVGKVNSASFHNWNAGELLFLGLVHSDIFEGEGSAQLCDLTFRFDIRCGGMRSFAGVDIDHVDGWDHLWALRHKDFEGNGVRSVHVSRLYERASFSQLDL